MRRHSEPGRLPYLYSYSTQEPHNTMQKPNAPWGSEMLPAASTKTRLAILQTSTPHANQPALLNHLFQKLAPFHLLKPNREHLPTTSKRLPSLPLLGCPTLSLQTQNPPSPLIHPPISNSTYPTMFFRIRKPFTFRHSESFAVTAVCVVGGKPGSDVVVKLAMGGRVQDGETVSATGWFGEGVR